MSDEQDTSDVAEDAAPEDGEAEGLLSDDEKDALLAGMADGSVVGGDGQDAVTVTPFVMRPDAYINYGSYPLLQAIASKTAKRLRQRWGKLVNGEVSIAALDLFTATYASATEQLRPPVMTFRISLAPLPGHSIVIMDNVVLGALVEGFFGFSSDEGESTEGEPSPPAIREQFTRGERRVAELAIAALCEVLSEAWEKTYPIEVQTLGSETDPAVGSGLEPKDAVIVSSFTVEFGGASGTLHWLLPESQIAPVADDLEGATNARPSAPDPVWYARWREHLADIDVAASATVGRMRLPLRRVVRLAPGDLIALSDPELARLNVGSTECAQGTFGNLEGNNAIQISRWTVG
ncbi:MAG: FliM/FliN family flagellar motor switch protein [Pseudomonadota bacterium]